LPADDIEIEKALGGRVERACALAVGVQSKAVSAAPVRQERRWRAWLEMFGTDKSFQG
jgi:hypothetical protein